MTRAIGSNAIVKFCQEQTWGVTPDPSALGKLTFGMNLRSEGLGLSKNTIQSQMINQYRSVVGLTDGNKAVAGNIVTDLLPEGIEVLFRHLLGKPTVTTTGSGPYTHIMKGDPGYLEGLSFEKGFPNINEYILYSGCRINTCTIDIPQEGFAGVTFDFVGKAENIDTSTQITGDSVYGTKDGFNGYQCTVYTNNTGSYVALGKVTKGTITISNNIETDAYVLGSAFRADEALGTRDCKGDFEIFFEDLTIYNLFVNGTSCGIKFVFDNGVESIIFEFPEVKIGGESPKIASAGGVNLPLNFTAKRNTAAATDIIVTFVNSTVSVETAPGE